MASEQVNIPDGYAQDLRERIQKEKIADGAFWVNLYVKGTRTLQKENKDGTNMLVRDISWSYSGPHGPDDGWWGVSAALWNAKAGEIGDVLAELFAPPAGKKSIGTRIMYDTSAVYTQKGTTYLKIDPKAYHIWLHRPLSRDTTPEQRDMWDHLSDGHEWIDLYTLAGSDTPAIYQQVQEKPREPVLVTANSDVTINADGLVDM
jgi:hypothetical protein